MKDIILIAPPAAGKGTQSAILEEKYGMNHISTGDLLREVAGNGTEFGNKIAALMNSGALVDDETMAQMLKDKIISFNNDKSIIFDGFPRNIKQADILEELLTSLNRKLGYVIYLEIDKEEAKRRIVGRISCPKCGAIFNLYNPDIMPKVAGICDRCGGELIHRDDDNEETFNKRFDTYMEKTAPLIEYYENKKLLYRVNSGITKEFTSEQVEKIINEV